MMLAAAVATTWRLAGLVMSITEISFETIHHAREIFAGGEIAATQFP